MDYSKNLDLKNIVYFCEFNLEWKTEQWKDIPYYEGEYMVSDLGRVKSIKFNKLKILRQGIYRYCNVVLSNNNKQKSVFVHILVSVVFLNHIPCGFDLVVNHKNFIRTDNRKLNLEIITNRKNTDKKHIKNNNKYTGVYVTPSGKFTSSIWIVDRKVYLGTFVKEKDAVKAYNDKLNEIT